MTSAISGAAGANGINSKIASIFNAIDLDKDGKISKSEFSNVLSAAVNKGKTPKVSFEQLSGGKDSISLSDLLNALHGAHKGHHHAADINASATTGASAMTGATTKASTNPSAIPNLINPQIV